MNRLNSTQRAQVVAALVEGASINGTARMTGASKPTILKLMLSWLVADRSALAAQKFMSDVASRLAHRVQLTTDGHRPYLEATERAFGSQIDYAMLEKLYANPPKEGVTTRYSPSECCGTRTKRITGSPDGRHISTSYAERQNLQMRMSMRRFTRLTNAHSKKIQNHIHAISLYFMYYNFVRIHQTLRVTPAMTAELADHVWTLEELVELLNPNKGG